MIRQTINIIKLSIRFAFYVFWTNKSIPNPIVSFLVCLHIGALFNLDIRGEEAPDLISPVQRSFSITIKIYFNISHKYLLLCNSIINPFLDSIVIIML